MYKNKVAHGLRWSSFLKLSAPPYYIMKPWIMGYRHFIIHCMPDD